MNFQDSNMPDRSTFILSVIVLVTLAAVLTRSEMLTDASGGIVLVAGGWATWKVGRWLWTRYSPNHVPDMIR